MRREKRKKIQKTKKKEILSCASQKFLLTHLVSFYIVPLCVKAHNAHVLLKHRHHHHPLLLIIYFL